MPRTDDAHGLFVQCNGLPMVFHLPPGSTKKKLAPLIKQHGGEITSRNEKNIIRLADEKLWTSRLLTSSSDCYWPTFIVDCVKLNTLLNMEHYKCSKGRALLRSQSFHLDIENNSTNDDDEFDFGEALPVTVKNKKGRMQYTKAEDMNILNYLVENGEYRRAKGIAVWTEMEKLQITPHSGQSMMARYRKVILAQLDTYNILESWKTRLTGDLARYARTSTTTSVATTTTTTTTTGMFTRSTPDRGDSSGSEDVTPQPSTSKADHTSTSKSDHTSPSKADRTSPSKADRTSPSKADRTSTSKADHTSPSKADHTSPSKADRTSPSKADRTSTSKADRTSTSKADRTSPSKADRTSTSKADRTSTSKADHTSPSKADRTSTSKADRTSTSKADRTSPSKADHTSTSKADHTSTSRAGQRTRRRPREENDPQPSADGFVHDADNGEETCDLHSEAGGQWKGPRETAGQSAVCGPSEEEDEEENSDSLDHLLLNMVQTEVHAEFPGDDDDTRARRSARAPGGGSASEPAVSGAAVDVRSPAKKRRVGGARGSESRQKDEAEDGIAAMMSRHVPKKRFHRLLSQDAEWRSPSRSPQKSAASTAVQSDVTQEETQGEGSPRCGEAAGGHRVAEEDDDGGTPSTTSTLPCPVTPPVSRSSLCSPSPLLEIEECVPDSKGPSSDDDSYPELSWKHFASGTEKSGKHGGMAAKKMTVLGAIRALHREFDLTLKEAQVLLRRHSGRVDSTRYWIMTGHTLPGHVYWTWKEDQMLLARRGETDHPDWQRLEHKYGRSAMQKRIQWLQS